MRLRLFLPVVAALAVLGLAAAAYARPAATPVLKGTVGPGFTITLTKDGKKVKTLKPGKYVFKITERRPSTTSCSRRSTASSRRSSPT